MALLPIFCVARSSRTDLRMIVARALKIGKIADGGMPPTYETMHYTGVCPHSKRRTNQGDGLLIELAKILRSFSTMSGDWRP
jgi:hypothetical protein